MEKERLLRRWLFWFSFALAAIIVYKFLDNFSSITDFIRNFINVVKPFLFAILFAYLLYIPCKKIESAFGNSKVKWFNKHKRGLSVLSVYVIALTIIFIIINFIWPTLLSSMMDLVNNMPSYYQSALSVFEDAEPGSWQEKIAQTDVMQNLKSYNISENLKNFFIGGQIGEYFGKIMGAANTIFDVFVTFVVSIYILVERADIKSFCRNVCKAVFNEEKYNKIRKYFNSTNTIFANFITGQLLDAFVVGTAMAITLSIMNVKYSIVLGYMIGFFNLIPYFGAIFGSCCAGLITVFTGGWPQALWLGFWCLVIQQIDGNIINPRILGSQLRISPILVIFAVTVGGAYFGIVGMFLGVPTLALIKVIVNDTIEDKILEKEALKKAEEKPKGRPKAIKVEVNEKQVKKVTTKKKK